MLEPIQWSKVNEILLQCGEVDVLHDFEVNVLQKMQKLIPFDQGRIYFMSDNAKVYDEYLLGVDKQTTREYHEFYADMDNGFYSATRRAWSFRGNYPIAEDWSSTSRQDRFLSEHLRPQGIHFSTGFLLCDLHRTPKVLFCMDRTGTVNYTASDLDILYHTVTHLNNMYRKFYTTPPDSKNVSSRIQDDALLTKRESEIAALSLRGLSPAHIADKLCISRATVYKHIAHIHSKLHVSTQQELIIKLTAN